MSYDTDLFGINVSEEFTCSMCLCVLKEPSQLNCEHLFCRQCILSFLQRSQKDTQFCPVDRKPAKVADIKPAHKSITNIINKMDVKCRNYTNGCKQTMKLEKLDEHDDICQYNPCTRPNRIKTSTPDTITISVILVDITKTIIITCRATDTVLMLKRKIEDKEGIPVDEQNLVFGSTVLVENEKQLIHYNIHNNCHVFISRRWNGGNQ